MSSQGPIQTDAEAEPIKDTTGINRSKTRSPANILHSRSGEKIIKSSSEIPYHSFGYSSNSETNLVSSSPLTNLQSARPFSDENKSLYSDYVRYFKDEKLKEDNCDILIIHAESDKKEATNFKEHLKRDIVLEANNRSLHPRVKLLEEFILGSSFEHLDFAFSKSLYVFLYVTKEFCDCTWSLLQGQACLIEAIRDPERKWCVIPVHTRSRKNQNYKLPMMLGSLRPINYWKEGIDQFYTESVRKLLDSKLAVLLQRDQILEEDRSRYFELNKEQILRDCAHFQNKSSCNSACSTSVIQTETDYVPKLISVPTKSETCIPTTKDMGAADSKQVNEKMKQLTLNDNPTVDNRNSLKASIPFREQPITSNSLSSQPHHFPYVSVPTSTEIESLKINSKCSSIDIDGPANIETQSAASRDKSPMSHQGSPAQCVSSVSEEESVNNAAPFNLLPGSCTHPALSTNSLSGAPPHINPMLINSQQTVMGQNGTFYVTTPFGYHLVTAHAHSMQPGALTNQQLPYHVPFFYNYNPYMFNPVQQPSWQPTSFAPLHSSQSSSTSEGAQSSIQANISSIPSQFISGSTGCGPSSITQFGFYNPSQTFAPEIMNPRLTQNNLSGLSNRGDFTNITPQQRAGNVMPEINVQKEKSNNELSPVDAAGDKVSEPSPLSPSALIAPVVKHIHHHHHKKEIRVEKATNILIGDQSKFINNSTVQGIHAENEQESTDEDEDASFEKQNTGLKTSTSRLERPSAHSADCIQISASGGETSMKEFKKEPVEQAMGYPECCEPVTREPIETSNNEADNSLLNAEQHQTYAKYV